MSESLVYKPKERVVFSAGKQHRFLLKSLKKSKLSWSQFADKIGVHKRIFNDWRREKYSLPYNILKKVCIITKSKKPKNIEIRERFWYTHKGGRVGGVAVYKKYGRIGGDPEYRKKKWREWWEKEGRYKNNLITVPKQIWEPKRCKELAEFVGIMIGDGGITQNQIKITLNNKTDKVYSDFVKNLIKKLFKVKLSSWVDKNDSTINIIVSRVRLVKFCKSIGLKIGNKLKQNLDIPEWVKNSKSFRYSCTRGLLDTDGCLFNECHRINNKKYCYPRLAFTSYSKKLCSSVFKIFQGMGFSPKIRNNRNVQIENRKDILRYFQLVSTHNLHHRKRFKSFLEG